MNQPAADLAPAPAAQPSSEPAAAATSTASSATPAPGAPNPGTAPAVASVPAKKEGEGGEAAPVNIDSLVADYGFTDLPEGMGVDKALLGKFGEFIGKHNLPPEVAKDLAAMYKANAVDSFKAQAQHLQSLKDGWYDQCVADTEIGGPGGSNFEANAGIAHKAIAQFGSPELQTLLKDSGMGNHPTFVKFCLKVGRAISEDSTFAKAAGSQSAAPVGHIDEQHAATLFPEYQKK